jgi:hypothetical protein
VLEELLLDDEVLELPLVLPEEPKLLDPPVAPELVEVDAPELVDVEDVEVPEELDPPWLEELLPEDPWLDDPWLDEP